MWKIQIPKTESKVEEATLFKWHKKEGDKVIKGELIAEIETFKAAVEINSPETGIIYKIFVEDEETVPENTVIAILIEEGEEISPEDIKPFLRNQEEDSLHPEEEKLITSVKDIVFSDIKKEKILFAHGILGIAPLPSAILMYIGMGFKQNGYDVSVLTCDKALPLCEFNENGHGEKMPLGLDNYLTNKCNSRLCNTCATNSNMLFSESDFNILKLSNYM